MENELIKYAASQGIFAALFAALLFYVLKENSRREERLMEFFNVMSEKLSTIDGKLNSVLKIMGKELLSDD